MASFDLGPFSASATLEGDGIHVEVKVDFHGISEEWEKTLTLANPSFSEEVIHLHFGVKLTVSYEDDSGDISLSGSTGTPSGPPWDVKTDWHSLGSVSKHILPDHSLALVEGFTTDVGTVKMTVDGIGWMTGEGLDFNVDDVKTFYNCDAFQGWFKDHQDEAQKLNALTTQYCEVQGINPTPADFAWLHGNVTKEDWEEGYKQIIANPEIIELLKGDGAAAEEAVVGASENDRKALELTVVALSAVSVFTAAAAGFVAIAAAVLCAGVVIGTGGTGAAVALVIACVAFVAVCALLTISVVAALIAAVILVYLIISS